MRAGGLFALAWVGASGSTANSQPVLAMAAQQMSGKTISGEEIEQGKGWTFSGTFFTPGSPKPFMQHWQRLPSVVALQMRVAAITRSLSSHTLALGEQRRLCPGREYWLSFSLFRKCAGISAVPSGSPPEMARRELGVGFPWQKALLTAALQVELQRAGPCTHGDFLPCVLYALECTTYKLENESLEEEVRAFQFCNFLWQSLHLTLQHGCFWRSPTQNRYPAVLWGTRWDKGNVTVLKLFKILTPG